MFLLLAQSTICDPATPEARPEARPDALPEAKAGARESGDAASDAPAGVVDPMQWWNALTQQFRQLATSAVMEGAEAMSANVGRRAAAVGSPTAGAGRAQAKKPSGQTATAAPRKATKKAAPGKTARKAARRAPDRKSMSA